MEQIVFDQKQQDDDMNHGNINQMISNNSFNEYKLPHDENSNPKQSLKTNKMQRETSKIEEVPEKLCFIDSKSKRKSKQEIGIELDPIKSVKPVKPLKAVKTSENDEYSHIEEKKSKELTKTKKEELLNKNEQLLKAKLNSENLILIDSKSKCKKKSTQEIEFEMIHPIPNAVKRIEILPFSHIETESNSLKKSMNEEIMNENKESLKTKQTSEIEQISEKIDFIDSTSKKQYKQEIGFELLIKPVKPLKIIKTTENLQSTHIKKESKEIKKIKNKESELLERSSFSEKHIRKFDEETTRNQTNSKIQNIKIIKRKFDSVKKSNSREKPFINFKEIPTYSSEMNE